MPIKKKKISELTLADSMVGLYTIGVKMINGVQTSVKVSLEFIKNAYDDVVAATKKAIEAATAADTSRKQIEANESTRQNNESSRVDAEKKRISAEATRATVEKDRMTAETSRATAETARIKAETARASAESSRANAEKERVSAETARAKAETTRVDGEKTRVSEFATIKKNAETATGNANTQADRAKEQADNPPKMGDNGNWWQWDDTLKKYVDTGVLAKGGVIYPTFTIEDDMRLYMSFEDEVSPQLIKFDEATGELFLNVG